MRQEILTIKHSKRGEQAVIAVQMPEDGDEFLARTGMDMVTAACEFYRDKLTRVLRTRFWPPLATIERIPIDDEEAINIFVDHYQLTKKVHGVGPKTMKRGGMDAESWAKLLEYRTELEREAQAPLEKPKSKKK